MSTRSSQTFKKNNWHFNEDVANLMKAFVKRGSALFSIFCLKGGVLGNLKEQFGWGHLRQNLLVSVLDIDHPLFSTH